MRITMGNVEIELEAWDHGHSAQTGVVLAAKEHLEQDRIRMCLSPAEAIALGSAILALGREAEAARDRHK